MDLPTAFPVPRSIEDIFERREIPLLPPVDAEPEQAKPSSKPASDHLAPLPGVHSLVPLATTAPASSPNAVRTPHSCRERASCSRKIAPGVDSISPPSREQLQGQGLDAYRAVSRKLSELRELLAFQAQQFIRVGTPGGVARTA